MTETNPTQTHGGERRSLTQREILVVFSGLMLAVLMAALDMTIVATALPSIVGDLQGLEHMPWVITAYLLSMTIGLSIYGKLGDLFGRKPVFMFAIVVFVAGSALTGAAQDMGQLIAFRALQGIGGGGLMIGAQGIIGDLVSPRERGRYMGLIGAVFGVATIGGPLAGGFLTDNFSWRWVFYINVPLGILTLGVVARVLKLPRPVHKPVLDYAGALLLAAAVTCIVLVTSWGGTEYEWGSPTILTLAAAAVVLTAAFLLAERRAADPVIPLRFFRDNVFNTTSVVGFLMGVGMFAGVSYLPSYFQMVDGASATGAGLRLLPMVFTMLVAAAGSGQLITRTGRYKIFPVVGTVLAGIGLGLLSTIDADTSYALVALYMAVLGLGLGLVMQVLILAVQNSVPHSDLGAATSAANFFRQIGGSIGAAVFGSVFTNRLTDGLAAALPPGAGASLPDINAITPALLRGLPAGVQETFVDTYADALAPVFLYVAPGLAVAFVFALLMKEKPLRTTANVGVPADRPAEARQTQPQQAER